MTALEPLRAALRADCGALVEQLLGPRNRAASNVRTWRFGACRGSLAVEIAGPRAGVWFDHADNTGGDLLDLIRRARGGSFADAAQWAEEWTKLAVVTRLRPPPSVSDPPNLPERCDWRIRWTNAIDIPGTPAERYLRRRGIQPSRLPLHAGLPGSWPGALRWHAQTHELLIAVNDVANGVVAAVQRILLNCDGTPRRWPSGKSMNISCGSTGGGRAVRFGWQPDAEGRWGVAEGAETALAAAQLLGQPVVASLGAANLPKVAPPSWALEAIIVFDHDVTGERAAQAAAEQHEQRGIPVRMIRPIRPGADAADVALEGAS